MSNENQQRLAAARAKYGNNRWWESDDLRRVAWYQIHEDVLCVTPQRFHAGVELLLGRPVDIGELIGDAIIRAADEAWQKGGTAG